MDPMDSSDYMVGQLGEQEDMMTVQLISRAAKPSQAGSTCHSWKLGTLSGKPAQPSTRNRGYLMPNRCKGVHAMRDGVGWSWDDCKVI